MNTSVGLSMSEQVGISKSISVGQNFTLEAGDTITLKVGASQLVMKSDGTITLSGKDITIKGSGDIKQLAGGSIVNKASTIHNN